MELATFSSEDTRGCTDCQSVLPDRTVLLNVQQVARRYGVTTRTIWRWHAAGRIPRRVRITSSTVRWLASDIDRHVAALKSSAEAAL
jgi:predicted DNA-binding transcriptional regulator AlpA